ncbi:hypothetical protein BDB00DRAFT_793743 [Zychaea mexicana]|uniref:uncharacterized protein n=1 Tax=Zychaea mexicana TaxID=64656 RepID=UPI0022FE50CA|nr:uncharacterized protein BDB00DRAFT_793743 [Zychaea mexicana]KAI9468419.1 hypothetical protein BDB00DRAFT_793743 [Zychaea mexicana]
MIENGSEELWPNKKCSIQALHDQSSTIHPDILLSYITDSVEIKPDGWCRFRTLSYLEYKSNQDKYADIKKRMHEYMVAKGKSICLSYICGGSQTEYEKLVKRMSYGVAFGDIEADCPKEYWFDGSVDI